MLNSNNEEKWLPVKGFEDFYSISTKGAIRNSRKLMKPFINNRGYLCIDFTVNKQRTKHLVHRLVAQTFIENPDNLPEVNHINELKLDNTLENLEWSSRSHNKRHSMATGAYDSMYTNRNTLGKKHLPNPTSKYHNVSYDKYRDQWVATIRSKGVNLERKRFNSPEEAALHVNYLIDKYGLHDRTRNVIT